MKAKILFIPLMGFAVLAAFGAAVMFLWNLVLSPVLGIMAITFWQALGIFILARILFGGFGHFRHHHGRRRFGGMHHPHHHHGNQLREKWMKMSPEQRKEFVKRRREWFSKNRGDWGRGYEQPFDHEEFFDGEDFYGDKNEHPGEEK